MSKELHSNSTMTVRKGDERGHSVYDWLNSYHTFSFADYYDPAHMGFRSLRVINEDKIQGGSGFSPHSHKDMEIISYVVSGGLEHSDSMGNKTVILPDEVQIMSAGTGIKHAEMNHFKDRETHFFQIWIIPESVNITPSYGQKSFKEEFKKHPLVLVASQEARNGSIRIHRDVDIFVGRLKPNAKVDFVIREGRHIWLQMVKGNCVINAVNIHAGDGLAISNGKTLAISSKAESEFILMDLG